MCDVNNPMKIIVAEYSHKSVYNILFVYFRETNFQRIFFFEIKMAAMLIMDDQTHNDMLATVCTTKYTICGLLKRHKKCLICKQRKFTRRVVKFQGKCAFVVEFVLFSAHKRSGHL